MVTVEPAVVELCGGLVVPVAALEFVLALEQRGLRIRLCGDTDVLIGPPHLLTDQDRAEVRRWKPQVRALVAYALDVAEHGLPNGRTTQQPGRG